MWQRVGVSSIPTLHTDRCRFGPDIYMYITAGNLHHILCEPHIWEPPTRFGTLSPRAMTLWTNRGGHGLPGRFNGLAPDKRYGGRDLKKRSVFLHLICQGIRSWNWRHPPSWFAMKTKTHFTMPGNVISKHILFRSFSLKIISNKISRLIEKITFSSPRGNCFFKPFLPRSMRCLLSSESTKEELKLPETSEVCATKTWSLSQ